MPPKAGQAARRAAGKVRIPKDAACQPAPEGKELDNSVDEQKGFTGMSITSAKMIRGWRAELENLAPAKQKKWHGRLWDKWGVAQKVRHVGPQKNEMGLAYEFQVWKQPDRKGGGSWWAVIEENAWRAWDQQAQNEHPQAWREQKVSSYHRRFMESDDFSATFREVREEINAESKERSPASDAELLQRVVLALPPGARAFGKEMQRELQEEGCEQAEAKARAFYRTMFHFPAEALQALDEVAPGRLEWLRAEVESEVFDEMRDVRQQMKETKQENRCAAARARAKLDDMPIASATSLSEKADPPQDPAVQYEQEVQEGIVKQLNEAARAEKEARRKATALQPNLAAPLAAAVAEEEEPAPAGTAPVVLSKNAQKRRDQRERRRKAAQRREAEKQQAVDEEFMKVVKQTERLRLREPEDVECAAQPDLAELHSVKALGSKLHRLEKETARAKSRPVRARGVEQAMLETSTLSGQMRQELVRFVDGFSGVAPDADAFAERLVEMLLGGDGSGDIDLTAAKSIFGEFASAYVAYAWTDRRLRVGRHVVFRAAALAAAPAE